MNMISRTGQYCYLKNIILSKESDVIDSINNEELKQGSNTKKHESLIDILQPDIAKICNANFLLKERPNTDSNIDQDTIQKPITRNSVKLNISKETRVIYYVK